MSELRESISTALAKIPVLLNNTNRVTRVFKSRDLYKWSANLYVATLGILDHILLWYKQKAISESLGPQ